MNNQPKLTRGLLAILAFLAMTGPLATDMYLSSFPSIAADFEVSASEVQLTLMLFLIGFSVGQLVLGPVSDRFGRRRVLLWSVIVFVIAGVATVLAPNIWALIVFRLLQGLSGAGGVVLARAVAADLTEGRETIRVLSLIAMFVGLGPILGPSIGAFVGEVSGWRGVMATITVLGIIMLVLTAWRVPESHPAEARQAGGVSNAFKNFGALLTDARFVMLLVAFSASFAGMMAYIAASPFVGQMVLGMTPVQYALGFGIGAVALVLSNFLNAQLSRYVNPARALLTGSFLSLGAAVTMLVLVAAGLLSVPFFVALAFILIFGVGFSMSNGSALAFLRAGFARGSASALLGAGQFLIGSIVTPIVGAWGEHTALPMAIAIVALALTSFTAAAIYLAQTRRDKLDSP